MYLWRGGKDADESDAHWRCGTRGRGLRRVTRNIVCQACGKAEQQQSCLAVCRAAVCSHFPTGQRGSSYFAFLSLNCTSSFLIFSKSTTCTCLQLSQPPFALALCPFHLCAAWAGPAPCLACCCQVSISAQIQVTTVIAEAVGAGQAAEVLVVSERADVLGLLPACVQFARHRH